ncbi:MAG TPA: metallophosphoesterase, partial [Leptospiraceae bacterium]|nr:metallophosphoesterase [Leptospiraceae bacterium]
MGVRTIFIGDVHGCVDELKEMIGILGPTREDRIILLGDLINRGPDSPGVVRFVFENGFESLMGNH